MLDALWRKRLVLRRPHRLSNRQFPYCCQSGHYTLAGSRYFRNAGDSPGTRKPKRLQRSMSASVISHLLTEVSPGNLEIADNPSESRRMRSTPEGALYWWVPTCIRNASTSFLQVSGA
jgi:hypothetical protein